MAEGVLEKACDFFVAPDAPWPDTAAAVHEIRFEDESCFSSLE
jgi:hypothetical protein